MADLDIGRAQRIPNNILKRVEEMKVAVPKAPCAFLFPGQGSQSVGMAKTAQRIPAAAALFSKANDMLGYNLLDICVRGPKVKLDSTGISQLAIFVTSLAAIESLRAREGGQDIIDSVDVACGLSLGEYPALVFAGSLSFEDGLELVRERGEAMQAAADASEGAMASVIGLDAIQVKELCDTANEQVGEKEQVHIANHITRKNLVVSGGVKGVQAVKALLQEKKGTRFVPLAVSGAFHTDFMSPAVPKLKAALARADFREPRVPVISNVDARPHSNDPKTIREMLTKQLTSPVQWEGTVRTLIQGGLQIGYELGHGKVISGSFKQCNFLAIESVDL